jgi:hypothetical protein
MLETLDGGASSIGLFMAECSTHNQKIHTCCCFQLGQSGVHTPLPGPSLTNVLASISDLKINFYTPSYFLCGL